MPRFQYRAKRAPDQMQEGVVEAGNLRLALEAIRRQDLFPLEVVEQGTGLRAVEPAGVALFTRQLADLLDAGLPPLRALEVARRQAASPRLSAVLSEVQAQVQRGRSLSAALAQHPNAFPPVYTSVVRAGEAGNAVAPALDRLAAFYEVDLDFRSRIRSAAAYPLLVGFVGFGTVLFLLTFVIPRLGEMVGDMGQALPWLTRALLALSVAWRYTWWAWVLGAAAVAAAFARFTPGAAVLLSRLPWWRQLALDAAISRFARTLETLLANGVPLLEALRVLGTGLGHPELERQLEEAARQVENGASLAESLQGRLPELVCQMIAVGEEGGRLDRALGKVAASYEKQFERATRLALSLLEPAMILVVGAVVGVIVMAMLLPILQLHTLVR